MTLFWVINTKLPKFYQQQSTKQLIPYTEDLHNTTYLIKVRIQIELALQSTITKYDREWDKVCKTQR